MSVFLQPIYTQTVGSGGAATVTFNNIPQGFTDLKILISTRSTSPNVYDGCLMTINGTSGTLYSTTGLQGSGSGSAYSARNLGGGAVNYLDGVGNGATANTFGNTEIYISNYTSGTFKSLQQDVAPENNASLAYTTLASSTWRSANPITSVTFFCSGGFNFMQYTTFTLYGVSNVYDTTTPTAPTIGTVTDQAEFASVAFTPASNDQADRYAVTTTPSSSTTFGASSPIVAPAVLDTSYTYQVSAVNSLGSSFSASSSALTTVNSWASIASFAITSSTASVTFSGIPQNYKHLALHITGMSANTSTVQVDMGFNNDGSQVYSFHQFYGSNTTASSGSSAPRNDIPEVAIIRANNQIKPGVSQLFLFDYNDTTKFKVCHWYLGNENLTTGYIQQATGMWRSFAPVSAITLTGRGASFGANSHIALYGIA